MPTQTAGDSLTTCLWHTDEPGDTLLLNYSTPRQLILLFLHQPPPPHNSPSSHLFFFLSSHSLCFTSLRFIKSRRDPCISPASVHVNQTHVPLSNRISAVSKLLLPHSFPSPYRACQRKPLQPTPIFCHVGSPLFLVDLWRELLFFFFFFPHSP